MLFRFQSHIDKLALEVGLGPEFILISPLNNREFGTKKNCLAKKPLEKETIQKN